MEPDFSGYATKAGLKCSDGRTITPEAFKHQDKMTVPLVWQHGHDSPENVLGHAILEARDNGIYTYAFFNGTKAGLQGKALVEHGDVKYLSIWANKLVEKVINGSKQVLHGAIREVSLVLAGANPGAEIDFVAVRHSDDGSVETLEDEAIIHTGLPLELMHSADKGQLEQASGKSNQEIYDSLDDDQKHLLHTLLEDEEGLEHAAAGAAGDLTLQEIYDSLTAQQKELVHYMIGAALESSDAGAAAHSGTNNNEDTLTHQEGTEVTNVFESQNNNGGGKTTASATLSHDQLKTLVDDAKKLGSFKESFLQHAGDYGIENLDLLFPDAQALSNTPELISRRQEWVQTVITGARKAPFSRIKSLSADITHDEARAKGYIKGHLKKEEWFALQKRTTTPTTIYKKQKLDREDIIEITDLDVVAWLKAEMRLMLDEEIARAVLIGDGRSMEDEDKVDENCIRPIATDSDFYTHKVVLPTGINSSGDALVEAFLRARKVYRGTGQPSLFVTEDLLTDLLLGRDKMGRRYYNSIEELRVALRVADIVPVDVLEGANTPNGPLIAILVNMADYTMGSTRGGQVSMFDDFDIDYNQYKYLMEGTMSGALTKFKSAIAFSRAAGTSVNPTVPTFNAVTGVLTIPNQTGVVYTNSATGAVFAAGGQPAVAAGEMISVDAEPDDGYYFPGNISTNWSYTRTAA